MVLILIFLAGTLTTGCGDVFNGRDVLSYFPSAMTDVGVPQAPQNATTWHHVEEGTQWKTCTGACSGCPAGQICSSGSNANYNPAVLHTSSPSLDGNSAEFQIFDGPSYSTALWSQSLGAHNEASQFLWDFFFMVNSTTVQALEWDFYQAINHVKYMFGSQCNYGTGVFDGWNEIQQHWVSTGVTCPKFTPNVWHHITWSLSRLPGGAMQYNTLTVDGTTYNINMVAPAVQSNWGNSLGFQIQTDTAKYGTGYTEWIDNMTISIW